MRANGSDLVNDFDILWTLVFRPCNDQVERVGRDREEGGAIVGNMLDAPVFARKNAIEQFIDLSVGINHKRDSLGRRGMNGSRTIGRCHGASKERKSEQSSAAHIRALRRNFAVGSSLEPHHHF
jgi:hypothetical protein